jgi:ribosomal protein S18 acetylase RimI-like enzyme
LCASLRPAGESDLDFLYLLYASTRASEMAVLDWSEQQKEAFLLMQFDAQHKYYHEQISTAKFDIIELDNEAIGRLYVDRRVDEIRIIDIALLPEYRGKGFGGKFMKSLLDEAISSKRSVTIHVEHNNPAMHLYQRLGFRHVRDEGVYFFMEWKAGDNSEYTASENTSQANTAS